MEKNNAGRLRVEMEHGSGAKFQVYLTPYELDRANRDPAFNVEIVDKYYKLYTKGLVSNLAASQEEPLEQPAEQENHQGLEVELHQEPDDDDEHLISLVSQRPPLFDFRLPLKDRRREVVNQLWLEVVSELSAPMTVTECTTKWKNIRDSYIRARANINKKIASGSSAEEKLKADNLRRRHKNYEMLGFLDSTLTTRRSFTNVQPAGPSSSTSSNNSSSPLFAESGESTSEKRGVKRAAVQDASAADRLFFEQMDKLCEKNANKPSPTSATQLFCMRLAASLEKLPRNVRTRLEIEFLQKIADAEEECGIED